MRQFFRWGVVPIAVCAVLIIVVLRSLPLPLSPYEKTYTLLVEEEMRNVYSALHQIDQLKQTPTPRGQDWTAQYMLNLAALTAISAEAADLQPPARFRQAHNQFVAALKKFSRVAEAEQEGRHDTATFLRGEAEQELRQARDSYDDAGWRP